MEIKWGENGYSYVVEFDIKSPAKKFFEAYIEMLDLSKDNETVVNETEPVEKTTFRITGFQIKECESDLKEILADASLEELDWYSKLEGTLTVTHVKGNDLGRATWTLEFDKIRPDTKGPESLVKTFIEFFMDLDKDLLTSS